MKNYILLFALAFSIFACKNENKTNVEEVATETAQVKYKTFGKEIIADDAVAAKSMAEHYKTMKVGDSIDAKMVVKVNEVCQAKGCWMKVDLEDGNEAMVKFKDYGFFMPKNIAGDEVIVNGKAYVNEVPVDELRHYAEDAGKTEEEIAAITEPKRTFSFEADGVLLVEE